MSELMNKTNFDFMFKGMEGVLRTDTVIGDPIKIDDATIVPIMEASFGMGAGSFDSDKRADAGGMGAKLSPVALLIVQNGMTRVMQIRDNDAISKAVDLIPDLISKIGGMKIDEKVIKKAREIAEEAESMD